ncbi:Uncharacterized protein TCM_004139 [Theobroma cacao]|uniref:Uncharacterized protein n=1 Tax=Theobroma cacao TaxID=3641 RepID=A0A061DP92_THECC|nr:Uncharacterized protein TCM_004139 [Theobroma cacao]
MNMYFEFWMAKLVAIKNSCLDHESPWQRKPPQTQQQRWEMQEARAEHCRLRSCHPACRHRILFQGCSCRDCDRTLAPDPVGVIEAQAYLLQARAPHLMASSLQVEVRLLKERKPIKL